MPREDTVRGEPLVKVTCNGVHTGEVPEVFVARQDVDAELEKLGWSTSWGMKDFCPACSKEREG